MHLSKITIRNYRPFGNVNIELNEGLNVIVGPNNTGKSNLLTAITHLTSDPNQKKSIDDICKYYILLNIENLKREPPFIEIKYFILLFL